MADVHYCVRGCTRLDRHISTCPDREMAPGQAGYCRGCEPRQAKYGLLCWPCHRRFQLMLEQAEITDRWLTGNLPAGNTAARLEDDAESRHGSAEPPTPLTVAIFDMRRLLRDRLACWADDLAATANISAPRLTDVTKIREENIEHLTLAANAKFILTWLSTVETFDWVADWFEEMAETMSDAHCLAPWRPTATRVPDIECPDCKRMTLVIFGGEEDVTCTSCRHIFDPTRYGIWERMFEAGEVSA